MRHLAPVFALCMALPAGAQVLPNPCLREARSAVETVPGPPGFPPPPGHPPGGGCERSAVSWVTSTCRLICVELPPNSRVEDIRHEVLASLGTDTLRWVAVQDGETVEGVGWMVMGGNPMPPGSARHCVIVSNRVLAEQRAEVRARVVLRYRLPAGACR